MFNLRAPGLSDRVFVGRVERLIARYRRGEIETIDVGNLDHQRDYVSAETASEQLRLIAERGCRGLIYHIGSGEPIRMRDLLHSLLAAEGVPASAVREGRQDTGRSGYDAPIIYADMRRTRALRNGTDQP
jgi:GDP-4-dehydro-6-deoxy-D-mannose reductase